MKNEKKHSQIIKIEEKDKSDILNTYINDRSLSWLGTGTSISGGVKNTFMGPNHSVTINVYWTLNIVLNQ